jgi:hypothetical protein
LAFHMFFFAFFALHSIAAVGLRIINSMWAVRSMHNPTNTVAIIHITWWAS